VQDLVEAAAKGTVLSAYLAKELTTVLFGIQHKTELCKSDSNYKKKISSIYNFTRSSTKSVPKKLVITKAERVLQKSTHE